MSQNVVYLGVKAHVVAIDKNTGATLWQTKLKGGFAGGERFVTILAEENRVFAHTCGELFCLDAVSGRMLWNNRLEGLSYDIASLATDRATSLPASAVRLQKKRSGDGGDAGGGGDGGH